MLRNIFLKTLRDNRWGSVGMVAFAVLYITSAIVAFPALYSGTAAQRAQQAADLTSLLKSFSVLYGEVVPVDNVGGFLSVRYLPIAAVFFSLWAVIVAAGLIRGEDEQGALDVLLTTPHSRVAVFWQKVGALGLGLAVILALMGADLLGGLAVIGETLPLDRILAELFSLWLMAAFWGAVALLFGQLLATRRTTSTLVGGLMFATYIVDNLVEGLDNLRGLDWVLPFHYFAVNKPLVPGRSLDYSAWMVLVALTVILIGLALWTFVRRDLGAVFPLLPARSRATESGGGVALLGSIFAKNLRDLLGATLGWGLALAAYGALMVSVANEVLAPIQDVIKNIPALSAVMVNFSTTEGYLDGVLFDLPIVLSFFALLQLSVWSGEEESGRMELLVAEPLPRPQILLARYAAVICSLIGVLALLGGGILLASTISNTPVEAGRVLATLFSAGIVTLVVLAFGLAIATWLKRPGGAPAITGAAIAVMFVLFLFAEIFSWPEAVRDLSIYYLYGHPMLQGVAWGNMAALVAATLLLAGASLAGFQRRDLAKQ
ncbi:MAG: ABC transporter permease subunit [Chloroflexia bacterium]